MATTAMALFPMVHLRVPQCMAVLSPRCFCQPRLPVWPRSVHVWEVPWPSLALCWRQWGGTHGRTFVQLEDSTNPLVPSFCHSPLLPFHLWSLHHRPPRPCRAVAFFLSLMETETTGGKSGWMALVTGSRFICWFRRYPAVNVCLHTVVSACAISARCQPATGQQGAVCESHVQPPLRTLGTLESCECIP